MRLWLPQASQGGLEGHNSLESWISKVILCKPRLPPSSQYYRNKASATAVEAEARSAEKLWVGDPRVGPPGHGAGPPEAGK